MSTEIKCPACGQTFKVDESLYANIVKQVRDAEFSADVEDRVSAAKREAQLKLEAANTEAQAKLAAAQKDAKAQLEAAQKDAQAKLQAAQTALENAQNAAASEKEIAVKDATAKLNEKLTNQAAEFSIEKQQLQAQIEKQANNAVAQREQFESKIEDQRERFEEKLEAQNKQFESELNAQVKQHESELAAQTAQHATELEMQRAQHASELKNKETEYKLQTQEQLSKLESDCRSKEEIIRLKDEEIERVKEYKAALSTKGLGESLEVYCSNLYEQYLRPNLTSATFEKDTKAVEGTKGDFIFRDFDEDGAEYISIEFEMKTEAETTSQNMRHTNESHMKKLDADRNKKGCEYAVLVSTLEPESDLYNQGIVDVSWKYPKMYVIRPQFFVPMITLLRNAARMSLRYKADLARVKQTNIDVTNFEEKLEKFKTGFGKNFDLAARKFDEAIKSIDKSIADMQKARDALVRSKDNLRLANGKAQDLTIRKLTYKNPTMAARFKEARESQAEE